MGNEIDFSCQKCGKQCDVAPDPPERAVCEECCESIFEEHDFRYENSERAYYCQHCGKPAPYEWVVGRFEE